MQGSTYLFFASRRRDGNLGPVNGPYSAFPIEAGVVLEWPNREDDERRDWDSVRKLIESLMALESKDFKG